MTPETYQTLGLLLVASGLFGLAVALAYETFRSYLRSDRSIWPDTRFEDPLGPWGPNGPEGPERGSEGLREGEDK